MKALDAVEQWAQAKGWREFADGFVPGETPWAVDTTALRIVRGYSNVLVRRLGIDRLYTEHWDLTPHAALVWALVVAAELPPVDVGWCKRCRGRGTWDEWLWMAEDWGRNGYATSVLDDRVHASRTIPCPNCSGTGRDRREGARLLLDALPRAYAEDERRLLFGWGPLPPTVRLGGCGIEVSTTHSPGDPASIEALLVLSDQLQPDLLRRADGPPRNHDLEALGNSIALLLAGPVAAADPRMAAHVAADIERLERYTREHRVRGVLEFGIEVAEALLDHIGATTRDYAAEEFVGRPEQVRVTEDVAANQGGARPGSE